MYRDEPLSPSQKFWLTIICFLITGTTIILVVLIAAAHGAFH